MQTGLSKKGLGLLLCLRSGVGVRLALPADAKMSVFTRCRVLLRKAAFFPAGVAKHPYARTSFALALASGCISVKSSVSGTDDNILGNDPIARSSLLRGNHACTQEASSFESRWPSSLVVVSSINEGGDDDAGTPISERARNIVRGVRRAGIGFLDGIERRWQTEGGRVVLQLIGTNVAVFALWKVVPTSFMLRHFASSLEAMRRGRVWTTVTANFSQCVHA
jgi:hypothetical protein